MIVDAVLKFVLKVFCYPSIQWNHYQCLFYCCPANLWLVWLMIWDTPLEKNYGGRKSNLVLSRLHELVDRKRSCSLKRLYIEPSNSSSMHSKNWKLYELTELKRLSSQHICTLSWALFPPNKISFCPYPIFVVLSM